MQVSIRASLVAQRLKRLPGMRETWVRTLGREDPLEKAMYSCLENPMEGRAWWATVHGVAKSRTRLSDFTFTSIKHLTNTKLMINCKKYPANLCPVTITEPSVVSEDQYPYLLKS